MSYCTPAQLVDSPDRLTELAQVWNLDGGLLAATVSGTDRSAWTIEEIAAADAALAAIERELTRVDGEVDARLATRGYALPLDAAQFPVLTVWARSIARYHLNAARNGDGADVEQGRVERDYLDARKALQLVADGKLSLGANDPLATVDDSSDGHIRMQSHSRLFNRSSLQGL